MSDEERAALVEYALVDLAREEIRRGHAASPPPSSNGNGSARWARARAWADQLYNVAGDWRRLGDCSADEVELIAEDYEIRAQQNAAYAARFRALAEEMRSVGAERVDDLLATEGEVA